jgi:iron only hydrogenase large subunit-like protein
MRSLHYYSDFVCINDRSNNCVNIRGPVFVTCCPVLCNLTRKIDTGVRNLPCARQPRTQALSYVAILIRACYDLLRRDYEVVRLTACQMY